MTDNISLEIQYSWKLRICTDIINAAFYFWVFVYWLIILYYVFKLVLNETTGIKIEGIMADSKILSQELCWCPEE